MPNSIYPTAKSVNMLSGPRFPPNANSDFRMPEKLLGGGSQEEIVKAIGENLGYFISEHYQKQVPRLTTLERYYQGYNDILYWKSDKANHRADNRITMGYPKAITNIRVGYAVGNPIQYKFNSNAEDNKSKGKQLIDLINQFNNENDIEYHDKMMRKNLSITGRAYELIYSPSGTVEIKVTDIDPTQAFVVYNDKIERKPLFGVYYFPVKFKDNIQWRVTVYTEDFVIEYPLVDNPEQDYEALEPDVNESAFSGVPLLEARNNAERMGDWESKLNEFDAADKSISEMANSQEDFNNAILCISGKIDLSANHEPILDDSGEPMLDDDGNILYHIKPGEEVDPKARVMFLKSSVTEGGTGTPVVTPTTAEYLVKELNADGWKTYMDKLNSDIHKDTNTPDVSDENFASNASGVAMSYKLWGQDQERAIQESLYKRMLMDRYRLVAIGWFALAKDGGLGNVLKDGKDILELVNQVQPVFLPNLPKNDAEVLGVAESLSKTGAFSNKTIQEYAANVTGVDSEEEQRRIKDEEPEKPTFGEQIPALNSVKAMQDKDAELNSTSDPTNTGADE